MPPLRPARTIPRRIVECDGCPMKRGTPEQQEAHAIILAALLEACAHLPRLPIEEERAIRAEFIRQAERAFVSKFRALLVQRRTELQQFTNPRRVPIPLFRGFPPSFWATPPSSALPSFSSGSEHDRKVEEFARKHGHYPTLDGGGDCGHAYTNRGRPIRQQKTRRSRARRERGARDGYAQAFEVDSNPLLSRNRESRVISGWMEWEAIHA